MRSHKIILTIISSMLFFPVFAFAAIQNPDETSGNYNMTLIGLVCLMITLLFIIGVLANVLRQLVAVAADKNRKIKQSGSGIVKTVLMILMFSAYTLNAMANGPENAVTQGAVFINGIPENDFYAIITMIVLELVVIYALVIFIRQLLKVISYNPELTKAAEKVKKNWFWEKFNKAVPIEKEKDLLLDHDYDGIQELDNSLPPWWKYGFYLTIVVAVIYLYRYHISHNGPSQYDEYVAEMQKGEEDKAAYLAQSANNVDESTVTMLTDAGALAEGKDIFIKVCAACHLADGGGTVGPNLTDEYWLHGGSIKDIFKSIKYGWQDKGMKSWKDDYSPKQIQELASFVKSLKGTHPATPKAPQGDIYIEATAASDTATGNTQADAK